ncbi:MAG: HNH endonuclease [Proteobacteria bacterium]|nr:HNH endonuclease [Pseudomonadota bacterium]
MKFFKFQNLRGSIKYSVDEISFIKRIPKNYKSAWDGNLKDLSIDNGEKVRNKLKKSIKIKINTIQEPFCIYCGIHFDIVGVSEREHIAPKGKHPEFVFIEKNLALACHYCNGSSKKHDKETIEVKRQQYKDCTFNIIHPYFDEYHKELDFAFESGNLILAPLNNSKKGLVNIAMFDLNGPIQSALRGGQILREKQVQKKDLEELIKEIRQNKYTSKN